MRKAADRAVKAVKDMLHLARARDGLPAGSERPVVEQRQLCRDLVARVPQLHEAAKAALSPDEHCILALAQDATAKFKDFQH